MLLQSSSVRVRSDDSANNSAKHRSVLCSMDPNDAPLLRGEALKQFAMLHRAIAQLERGALVKGEWLTFLSGATVGGFVGAVLVVSMCQSGHSARR